MNNGILNKSKQLVRMDMIEHTELRKHHNILKSMYLHLFVPAY